MRKEKGDKQKKKERKEKGYNQRQRDMRDIERSFEKCRSRKGREKETIETDKIEESLR